MLVAQAIGYVIRHSNLKQMPIGMAMETQWQVMLMHRKSDLVPCHLLLYCNLRNITARTHYPTQETGKGAIKTLTTTDWRVGSGNSWQRSVHTFDASQDNGNYGNPTAGHTGPEVRPASILLLPVVTY